MPTHFVLTNCQHIYYLFNSTTNFAQSVMLTLPFTVAVYMVRGFLHGEGDEQTIGRLTGLLVSV